MWLAIQVIYWCMTKILKTSLYKNHFLWPWILWIKNSDKAQEGWMDHLFSLMSKVSARTTQKDAASLDTSFSTWPLHVTSLGFIKGWYSQGSGISYLATQDSKRSRQKLPAPLKVYSQITFVLAHSTHICHTVMGQPWFKGRIYRLQWKNCQIS